MRAPANDIAPRVSCTCSRERLGFFLLSAASVLLRALMRITSGPSTVPGLCRSSWSRLNGLLILRAGRKREEREKEEWEVAIEREKKKLATLSEWLTRIN